MKNLYLILCGFVFVGCATYSTSNSYSMLSVNKINTSSLRPSEISAKGESCQSHIFNHFGKDSNALLEQAVQDAIKNANEKGFQGNALINVEVKQTIKLGFLRQKNCFDIEGKLVEIK